MDHLTKTYPGMIILRGEHNHPIFSADTLHHRDMSPETKEKLSALFRQGHSPSSAHYFLNIDLMMNSGENYYKFAADSRYLPTLSTVTKLFKKEFESEYGSFNGEDMFKNLETFLADYEKSGGKARFKRTYDNHYFVVICTPLMLRTHEKVRQSGDLVMLDASGGMDKQRHRLYAFVAPTAAGGLPLGIVVTDCEKEEVFTDALLSYTEMVSENAFFSKGYPDVFLTDNDMKERNALKKIFPKSTLLLCQFHMLKAMWSWLCNKKHSIDISHRQQIYFLFKNVVYSFDEASANKNASIFLNELKQYNYGNLTCHFMNLWEYKEDWVSCFRKNLATRGNNTTNYVEIVFRILKDIIFDRVLAYNITQLVDFIVTKYEMYMRQRLVSFSNGRYSNSLLLRMLPQGCDLSSLLVQHNEKEDNFIVQHLEKTYVVDMVRGLCSCSDGSCGKLCKHASAVFLKLEHGSTAYNIANKETKELMLFVAEGVRPNPIWFEPLPIQNKSLQKGISDCQNLIVNIPKNDNAQGTEKNDNTECVSTSSDLTPSESNNILSVTEADRRRYQTLLNRIEHALSTNPAVFVPALKKMLDNTDEFVSTESALASAMHTFGKYSGVKAATRRAAKQLLRRSHKTVIGVQPTAPARRKLLLSGRKKLNVGRPAGVKGPPRELSHHDYTSFGVLPKRKRKAPHNLDQCVYDNKFLGGH